MKISMRGASQWLATQIAKRAIKYMGRPLQDPGLAALLGLSEPTWAGVEFSENMAVNLSAFWCGMNCIANTLAAFPYVTYERVALQGKKRAEAHPLFYKLHDEPNPEMSSFTFRQTLQGHALSWGNGYAEIERSFNGDVLNLWPITPDRVTPIRDEANQLWYVVKNGAGSKDSKLRKENMFHIPGFGWDGVQGYNVIQVARESLGLTTAMEKNNSKFYKNSSRPSGFISHPGKINATAEKNIRESLKDLHEGLDNAYRLAVLEEGMEWKPLSFSPQDAQFLQSRQFQVVEIARWLLIQPHLLKDLSRATFSNIEHQGIDFLRYTLMPWIVTWEQETRRKLFRQEERRRYFAEHNVDMILRGDLASRYEAYGKGRMGGWLSVDEIKDKENENPLPGDLGKTYLKPTNYDEIGPTVNESKDDNVQNMALNGMQITAMMAIAQAMADKQLPAAAGEALIMASFPQMSVKQVADIINGLENFEPKPKEVQNVAGNQGNAGQGAGTSQAG